MSNNSVESNTLGLRLNGANTRKEETDNASYYVGFLKYDSSGRPQIIYFDTTFYFNPNTGVLTAPSFSGTLPPTTSINITSDTSSSAPQYLTFVAGTGSQNLKIANLSGMVYYPSTNVYATLGQLAIGTVGFGATAPQSGLYISEANTVDTYTNAGVHIGQDVANTYASIGLITSSATGVPYIKFAVASTAYDGKIEYHCGNNQMNFYVNESANTCLELKANSVDVEENLNANTGVINLISAGNTNLNFYESATNRWLWGYNPTSNYIYLQDVVNGRDIIKGVDGGNLLLNPYAVGDVQIGMNPSSNPSLEVKSTIIETNVDCLVQGDLSCRENFLVGDVSTYTLGHPTTLLKFHSGTSGYGINEASVFMGTGNVPTNGYGFGMYFGSNTGTGSSFIQTGVRTFTTGVNISNYNLLLQPHWGNVGISNTTPTYKFQVNGASIQRYLGAYGYYSGGWISGTAITTWVGTKFEYAIIAPYLMIESDRRIKTNIEEIVDSEALLKLRQLKPCKYNQIDTTRGNDKVYGFIAQEVKDVLPHAVNTTPHPHAIPNVYKNAVYNNNIITFDTEHKLETDGNIKLIIPHIESILCPYTIIDKLRINIDTSHLSDEQKPSNDIVKDENGNDLAHNIFVFGSEVDDFHTVNNDAIWTIATASLQEVDRIQQTNSIKIQKLEEENTKLKNEIELIKQHLNL